jgi:hypothetical protein
MAPTTTERAVATGARRDGRVRPTDHLIAGTNDGY